MDINPQTANYSELAKVRVLRGDISQFDDLMGVMTAVKPDRGDQPCPLHQQRPAGTDTSTQHDYQGFRGRVRSWADRSSRRVIETAEAG